MLLSMAAFAIEDALIKSLGSSLPLSQTLILFGIGGAVVFALDILANARPIFPEGLLGSVMALRAVFEAVGRLFFFWAVVVGSLSTATIILQATPIAVVLGAWLAFGERPTRRQMLALLAGAAGVFVVLQQSFDGLSWAAILSLVGMLGFAGRDLASRAAPQILRLSHLGFAGFLTIVIIGFVFSFWEGQDFRPVAGVLWVKLSVAVGVGVLAYSGLMMAMRTGDVPAVAPFRYFRLIFGVAIGVLFFGEELTVQTLFGAAMIILSGLLLLRPRAVPA